MKKREDGRYAKQVFIGYKPDGTRKMKTVYGRTIKEVEKKERDIKTQIETGTFISKDITFSEWADEWMATYKTGLAHNTTKRYVSILETHLKPSIGDMQLSSVRLIHIQKIINGLDGYSTSTLKKVKETVHQMYEAAIANEIAIKDPTFGLVIKKKDSPERQPISDIDIARIHDFYKEIDAGVFVMTLLYTGMRRGEIAALTWDDVDFENSVIHINKAATFKENQQIVKEPKTKTGIRDIPMLDVIRDVLLDHREKYKISYGDDLRGRNVFLNSLGHKHSEHSLANQWNKFMSDYKNRYGCETRFGMHQLRHTFCTMLYNAGVDIKTAQNVLGHSNVSITLSVYTHLEEKTKKVSIEKLNGYIQNMSFQPENKNVSQMLVKTEK